MILCLDVGNSQIYGGIFVKDQMKLTFRRRSQMAGSSDEIGIFLKTVLRENQLDPAEIRQIAICSVVPDALYSIRGACQKYFDIEPFVLQAGVKTGLKIKYNNPLEVGADRIADAIGASHIFPDKNLIVVDFGTATTVCATSKNKEFLGGNILPGVRLAMEALESKTAKLPLVEIVRPGTTVGKTTVESIQSGLFWGHLGAVRELTRRMTEEVFQDEKPLVVGTGGFAHLFDGEGIFDEIVSDLVLKGLFWSLKLNQ